MTHALIPIPFAAVSDCHVWLYQSARTLFDEVSLLQSGDAQVTAEALQAFDNAPAIVRRQDLTGPVTFTHVVGASAEIKPLAEQLAAVPLVLEPGSRGLPTNGNLWRKLGAKNSPMPPKRVCVYGPESTGKTMLAHFLADEFSTYVMPEYGRTYEAVYAPDTWTADMLVQIAKTHTAMRAALERFCSGVLIEDTDPLLTAVWSKVLCGEVDAWFDGEIPLADLYLVPDIDVPWVADGMRQLGQQEQRAAFQQEALALLNERGAHYVSLRGSWDERNRRATAAVRQLIAK